LETTQQNESLFPYTEMGVGFIIGLAIGYTLKKSFKFLLILLGIGMITVFILESKGVIQLNESSLETTIGTGVVLFKSFVSFLYERLDSFKVSSGLSAVAGFIAGIKLG
jgi:uncharacterized membrane protein (Fun14 family)